MKRVKTPQEKKRSSYNNDRRNSYGERGAHSRHSIRRRKRKVNRANRRNATVVVSEATFVVQEELAEAVQSRIEGKRPKSWKKIPDAPLGQWIEGRLERRSDVGINDKGASRDRIRRVRKNSGQ